MLIFFENVNNPATRLSRLMGMDSSSIKVHHFPDGESLVTLPMPLSKRVVIYQSLNQPNQKLVELMLSALGARSMGAKKLILVAPYLCYMRQDKAFGPGQVVSQKVIGTFLSNLFDAILTVDAHLHRVKDIRDVFKGCNVQNLSTARMTADYIERNYEDVPFLLGPDEESLQWVRAIASLCRADFGVCKKTRYGDADVKVELPDVDLAKRSVILIDDIISTGHTISSVAEKLQRMGVQKVDCIVTHALFSRGSLTLLRRSGIRRIISTDTVPHSTNRIFVAPVIAKALKNLVT